MGNPGPDDHHPLHGDLPNAPYGDVQLIVGDNSEGPFMALTGRCRQTVAFSHDYVTQPTVRLQRDATGVAVDIAITNLKRSAMELMYLAHINFRPVDGAVLVDAVPDDLDHMQVRGVLPPALPTSEHARFLASVRADPAIHRAIEPGRAIDPELVLARRCRAGADGWSHALQVLPDGTADFVSHRPDQLGHAVRWMTRNGDQEAMGVLLPSTADADGYTAVKAKGNLRLLPPEGEFRCRLEFGALDATEAEQMRRHIDDVMRSR
jgi:hypothetical protein